MCVVKLKELIHRTSDLSLRFWKSIESCFFTFYGRMITRRRNEKEGGGVIAHYVCPTKKNPYTFVGSWPPHGQLGCAFLPLPCERNPIRCSDVFFFCVLRIARILFLLLEIRRGLTFAELFGRRKTLSTKKNPS